MFRSISTRIKKRPSRTAAQKRQFSKNVHHISPDCNPVSAAKTKIVYRGIRHDVYEPRSYVPLFRAESIFFGLNSYYTGFDPNTVTIDSHMIASHKLSPIFLSTSLNKASAATFVEKGPLLTFDINNLENLMMVNADREFLAAFGGFYASGIEKELTVFALLYASIEFFELNDGNKFSNPFYLPVDPDDQESRLLLNELYDDLCRLHHYGRSMGGKSTLEYLQKFNLLYHKVFGDKNPLNMTLNTFQNEFPEYAKHFFHARNGSYRDRFFSVQLSNRIDKVTVLNFLLGNLSMKEYAFCINPATHRDETEQRTVARMSRDKVIKEKFKL